MKEFRRILVVRTDRIGDVILTLPMLELLRKQFPHAHIAMLIRHYTKDLLNENPYLDDVLLYDDENGELPFLAVAAELKKRNFDVVFITYPRFRLAMLMRWAGIPLRVGTGYRWYSFLFNKRVYVHRKVGEKHEAEYNVDLIRAMGCDVGSVPYPHLSISEETLESVKNRLAYLGLVSDKTIVLLHPGSGGSARDWKADNFGVLGKRLSALPNVQVVVTGGKGEESLVRHVAGMIGVNTPVVVNQLSLKEYGALTSFAGLLVANSTGPLHIAAATGTPVVGLYPQVTAMNAIRWGPFTAKKTILVPKDRPTNCTACICPQATECECMNSISIEEVFRACLTHLSTRQVADA
jgi:heptosyltransferase-3